MQSIRWRGSRICKGQTMVNARLAWAYNEGHSSVPVGPGSFCGEALFIFIQKTGQKFRFVIARPVSKADFFSHDQLLILVNGDGHPDHPFLDPPLQHVKRCEYSGFHDKYTTPSVWLLLGVDWENSSQYQLRFVKFRQINQSKLKNGYDVLRCQNDHVHAILEILYREMAIWPLYWETICPTNHTQNTKLQYTQNHKRYAQLSIMCPT